MKTLDPFNLKDSCVITQTYASDLAVHVLGLELIADSDQLEPEMAALLDTHTSQLRQGLSELRARIESIYSEWEHERCPMIEPDHEAVEVAATRNQVLVGVDGLSVILTRNQAAVLLRSLAAACGDRAAQNRGVDS